eukprot:3051009-Rhodomonas_salina.1
MPCGGGGFAGGGPGRGMCGKGNGVRPGFSGTVPGRGMRGIFWRGAMALDALDFLAECQGARGAGKCRTSPGPAGRCA